MDINGNYLILRHSTRSSIRNLNGSSDIPLTEEGIELAKHLGKVLSQYSTRFTFFHSRVFRCEQTANYMKEGIESNGKQVLDVKYFKPLGGFFNLNRDVCREIRNKNKYEFTRNWYDNKIRTDVIMPISDAANFMRTEILKQNNESTTKIFITHDWNLFCLKSLFLKTYEETTIPKFLEGIVINKDKKNFWIFEQKHFEISETTEQ